MSATLLKALAPRFPLLSVALKLSRPRLPVFYRCRVGGLKGRPFLGYKFTTMEADADEKEGRSAPLQRDAWAGIQGHKRSKRRTARPHSPQVQHQSAAIAINSFDEWVRLDYIHNWSLWLDTRILIRTVWAVLGGTGS